MKIIPDDAVIANTPGGGTVIRAGVSASDVVEDSVILDALQHLADRLRSTAAELRAGTMNRWHAANRIERIANEIARGK